MGDQKEKNLEFDTSVVNYFVRKEPNFPIHEVDHSSDNSSNKWSYSEEECNHVSLEQQQPPKTPQKKKLRYIKDTPNWLFNDSSLIESDKITHYSGQDSLYMSSSQNKSNTSLDARQFYNSFFNQEEIQKNLFANYQNDTYNYQINQSIPQTLFSNPHQQQTYFYPKIQQQLTPFQLFHQQQQLMRKNKRRQGHQKELDQFQIDLNKLESDGRATLMIKNIPNKYTQNQLLESFSVKHHNTFDFFYLPIDFTNKCNVGYAFINFKEVKYIKSFYEQYHHKKWEMFNSEKICELTYARIQGRDALQKHFEQSSIMAQKDKRLKPVFYFPQKELNSLQQLIENQKKLFSRLQ